MAEPQQKRDNEYYLNRLKDEHPVIYADYQAGKFKNPTQALTAAGIHKVKTNLQKLEAVWMKATQVEKDAFKAMIGCAPKVASAPVRASSTGSTTARRNPSTQAPTKNRLTGAEARAIREIMDRRKLKNGDVMREIGFKALDASMGMALARDTQIQIDLHSALKQWIIDNTQN